MDKKKIYVTSQGLEELKKELDELKNKKRPDVVDRVAKAREMGDLAENSEYTAARDELSLVDGRIEELTDILKGAVIIKGNHASGKKGIQLGSKVTVTIKGKKESFTVVGEWEADPHDKKISHESPLGRALLGKIVGERVEVQAPAGKILYTIVSVD